jgi:hypothetical protein
MPKNWREVKASAKNAFGVDYGGTYDSDDGHHGE